MGVFYKKWLFLLFANKTVGVFVFSGTTCIIMETLHFRSKSTPLMEEAHKAKRESDRN